ncbi:hypothetical protein D3C85_1393930 [compost metagenome]
MTDTTKQVGGALGNACQQVRTVEHGSGRGDHRIERPGGQQNVIGIADQSLADHHAHLLMITQHLYLMANALGHQEVIIAEELDQLS